MAEGLLVEESFFVLLMADVLLHGGLIHTLGLLYVLAECLKDAVHFGTQGDVFSDWASGALILHLPQHFLVCDAMQRMVFGIVCRIIQVCMPGHIVVHILSLDLEEQAVRVSVEELAALSILSLHPVVVEAVHQVLQEVEDAHPYIHRPIAPDGSCGPGSLPGRRRRC